VDPAKPARIVKDVPWLRMTFHDNSDFAPMAKGEGSVEVEDVGRGEEFIQAGVSGSGLKPLYAAGVRGRGRGQGREGGEVVLGAVRSSMK
jgi:hypothetical protein